MVGKPPIHVIKYIQNNSQALLYVRAVPTLIAADNNFWTVASNFVEVYPREGGLGLLETKD